MANSIGPLSPLDEQLCHQVPRDWSSRTIGVEVLSDTGFHFGAGSHPDLGLAAETTFI